MLRHADALVLLAAIYTTFGIVGFMPRKLVLLG
jgi:hypothetical protein